MMIRLHAKLERLTAIAGCRGSAAPILTYRKEWATRAGQGISIGLLDTTFDRTIADLCGAHIVAQSFLDASSQNGDCGEHGTFSVALLVGQGQRHIQGIAPASRLLVAEVMEPNRPASAQAVAAGIDWVVALGAQLVVLPIGQEVEDAVIARKVECHARSGVAFFAAAGNGYPEPVLFPAHHPSAIAVGAVDWCANMLPSCSRRPRLDLLAPGRHIAAPVGAKRVRRGSGTSVACVVAAGVTALAISAGAFDAQVDRESVLAFWKGAEPSQ